MIGLVAIFAALGLVACEGGAKPAPVPPPPVVVAAPIDATAVDAAVPPDADPLAPMHALQARLGAEASTCAGVAEILAWQISRPDQIKKLVKRCTDDRWNAEMRECVATAHHDPLSCSSHFKSGSPASKRFDDWMGSY